MWHWYGNLKEKFNVDPGKFVIVGGANGWILDGSAPASDLVEIAIYDWMADHRDVGGPDRDLLADIERVSIGTNYNDLRAELYVYGGVISLSLYTPSIKAYGVII